MNPRKKGRVLVVDDEDNNRDVLSRRLERFGYEALAVENGESALRVAGEHEPEFDLILLDLMMPGMSGFQVVEKIRERFSPAVLPVIMVTARDDSDDVVQSLALGANDYVTKPIDFPVLQARVETHVGLAASHRKLRAAQQMLIEAARMEAIGHLASGVAHEVRNPLAQVQMGLDFLALQPAFAEDPDTKDVIETMLSSVQRADAIIRGLMSVSRTDSLSGAEGNLNRLLENCLDLVAEEMERLGIQPRLDLTEPGSRAWFDAVSMEKAIMNLLSNALKAMPKGGLLTVTTGTRVLNSQDVQFEQGSRTGQSLRAGHPVVEIRIYDTGPGIPPAKLSTIFTPFYTTRATGQGMGLGLAVAKSMVDRHHGRLLIDNRMDGTTGVVATIWLPLRQGLRVDV